MSVKRYMPVTNGTAFMGMRCRDTPEWGNQLEFYVLSTDFDTLANELQATQCAEKMTADSLAEARAMNTKLAYALEECANRFEKCCVHYGSDREMATLAVSDYRALIESTRKP